MPDKGIQDLFAALVVSEEFREKFLKPETRLVAINQGYLGEHFDLSDDEIARLLVTEGENLTKFAQNFIHGAERQ